MKSNKVILFDCYQTVLDVRLDKDQQKINEQKGWEKFINLLKDRGIKVDVDMFRSLLEKRKANFYSTKDKEVYHHNLYTIIEDIFKQDLCIKVSTDYLSMLLYEYRKIARGSVKLYPKVAETLNQLAQQYTLAIASYTQSSFTQLELRELGIEDYFSHFIYSSDIGIHKKTPGFYEECLKVVGRDSVDCVMIGDHYYEDILASRQAGLKTIWIRNPITMSKFEDVIITDVENTIAIKNFDTLPQVIKKIFNV